MWSLLEPVVHPTSDSSTTSSPGHLSNPSPPDVVQRPVTNSVRSPREPVAHPTSVSFTTSSPDHLSNPSPHYEVRRPVTNSVRSPREPVAHPTSDSSTTSSPGHLSNPSPPGVTQLVQGLGFVVAAAHLLPLMTVPRATSNLFGRSLREAPPSHDVRILLKTPFVILTPLLP